MPQKTPQKPTRPSLERTMSFQIDPASAEKIEEIAIVNDRSVGSVLREAVRQFLNGKSQAAA